MLVGTDEGLYLLELNKTADSCSFIRIEGVPSVAMMSLVPSLNLILLVTGQSLAKYCVYVAYINIHTYIYLLRLLHRLMALLFVCGS